MKVTLENPTYRLAEDGDWPIFEATFYFDGKNPAQCTFSPEPKPHLLAHGTAMILGRTLESIEFLQSLPKVKIDSKEYESATNDPEIFQWLRQYVIDARADQIKFGSVELRELSSDEVAEFNSIVARFAS